MPSDMRKWKSTAFRVIFVVICIQIDFLRSTQRMCVHTGRMLEMHVQLELKYLITSRKTQNYHKRDFRTNLILQLPEMGFCVGNKERW